MHTHTYHAATEQEQQGYCAHAQPTSSSPNKGGMKQTQSHEIVCTTQRAEGSPQTHACTHTYHATTAQQQKHTCAPSCAMVPSWITPSSIRLSKNLCSFYVTVDAMSNDQQESHRPCGYTHLIIMTCVRSMRLNKAVKRIPCT